MSSIDKCIYPSFDDLTESRIEILFTPNEIEKAYCKQHAKKPHQQVFFMTMLLSVRFLQRTPSCESIPYKILRQVNQSMGHRRLTKEQFLKYGRSSTRTKHLKVIREYLDLKVVTKQTENFAYASALEVAKSKANSVDIINATIEHLNRNHFELPELSVLERIAKRAISNVNSALYNDLCNLLSEDQKKIIDELFVLNSDDEQKSDWYRVKTSPKKPSNNNVKEYLQYLEWLVNLANQLVMPKNIPWTKLKSFYDDARSLSASRMREATPEKRYALALVFIQNKLAQTLDNIAIIFIKIIQEMNSTGRQQLKDYYLQHKSKTDKLIGNFHDVLESFQTAEDEKDKLNVVTDQIDPNLEKWLLECDKYISSSYVFGIFYDQS